MQRKIKDRRGEKKKRKRLERETQKERKRKKIFECEMKIE